MYSLCTRTHTLPSIGQRHCADGSSVFFLRAVESIRSIDATYGVLFHHNAVSDRLSTLERIHAAKQCLCHCIVCLAPTIETFMNFLYYIRLGISSDECLLTHFNGTGKRKREPSERTKTTQHSVLFFSPSPCV